MEDHKRIQSSFRDPSGFLFTRGGVLYRQVNASYASAYRTLMESGLYGELTEKGLLVPHEEASVPPLTPESYRVIRPERIPFISYPYEWCFSELKDAALLTLRIQRIALRHGMTLKDASAYNIQFRDGRPILIDTLSFERYDEGMPWVAYRQFCQHFLAPLALMSEREVRLVELMRNHVDGIPLDLASTLLPLKSWFKPALFFHIHMHAKSQKRYAEARVSFGGKSGRRIDVRSLGALIENLTSGIRSLRYAPEGTAWGDYYSSTNYSAAATNEKRALVAELIVKAAPKRVWDLGANDGFYSRAASDRGIATIAFDIDPAAVEKNYLLVREKKEKNILPLVADLTSPSPALGWNLEERMSLVERGPADCALALALIHHLAITNNVPFGMAAEFFSRVSNMLIIEFVPKDDSQVERLLRNRADMFALYTKENFEHAFSRHFEIIESRAIPSSKRTLYLMKKRNV